MEALWARSGHDYSQRKSTQMTQGDKNCEVVVDFNPNTVTIHVSVSKKFCTDG